MKITYARKTYVLMLSVLAFAQSSMAMNSDEKFALSLQAIQAAPIAHKSGCETLDENSLDKMLCEQKDSSPLNAVLSNFLGLSKIYRKSGAEEEERNAIIKIAQSKGLFTKVDAAGNLLVRVPGTGSGSSKPVLALEAHMDMVNQADKSLLKNLGLKDPDEFMHKVGVKLVVENGWVHSLSHQSTIGADDGAGVAMMVRYIKDSSIPHPPLELIFTVHEEDGVGGASDLGKDMLTAKQLVNLDNGDATKIAIGCLGDTVIKVKYDQIKPVPVPAGFKVLDINVTGLPGGHSGAEIFLGRKNAAKLMAQLLGQLVQQQNFPEAVVLDARAGNYQRPNQIVSDFEVFLAVPAEKAAALEAQGRAFWANVQASFADPKNEQKATFTVEAKEKSERFSAIGSNGGLKPGLSAATISELARVIGNIDDGVVARSDKGQGFPHDILVSSNLGFLYFTGQADGTFAAEYYVMPRSFLDSEVDKITKKVMDTANAVSFHHDVEKEQSPAWTPTADQSPLQKTWIDTAAGLGMKVEVDRVEGGMETAFFAQNFPGIDAIGAGPTIEHEHSNTEQFNIESMGQAVKLLDAFLAKKAQSAQ